MDEGDGELGRSVSVAPRRTALVRDLWWAALTIGFALFVASGRVSTYLGAQGRGRADVWDIWRNLAGELPGGDSGVVRAGYVLVLLVFVGGSLVALWFALAADGSDEATGYREDPEPEPTIRPSLSLSADTP
ncbi:MAG: hypothetical protein QOF01_5308 [Thermomicrobiales bacterium]|nr:hypothetical protein [Thermomicrobiales bacterium]